MSNLNEKTGKKFRDVSVIIPVYNEIKVLEDCFSEVSRVLESTDYDYEIIFIDDGSSDGSTDKLISFCKDNSKVIVIQLKRNYGQQGALLIGLRYARGRSVITYDADLQFPPECILKLAEKILDGYDIAGGIRERRQDNFFVCRIPSIVGQYLINRALGIRQKDFGAIKGYSINLVQNIISSNKPNIIIPAQAYYLSKNFVEIPIEHHPRKFGKSKWSVFRRMESYMDIFTAYAQRPFEWMMVGGTVSVALGLVLALGIVLYKIFVSTEFSGLIIFLDISLIFVGIHFWGLSLIGEFVVRSYRGNTFEHGDLIAKVHTVGSDSE